MTNRVLHFKKVVFLFIISFFLSIGFSKAQSVTEEVDMYQSLFGMTKKALVAEFINNPDDLAFWSLYDEYETQRKVLGKKRLDLLVNYADKYDNMTDDDINDLVSQMEKLRKAHDALIYKYFKKMKKTSGAKVAAQFYQIEYYILGAVRNEVLSNIPFIGELEE